MVNRSSAHRQPTAVELAVSSRGLDLLGEESDRTDISPLIVNMPDQQSPHLDMSCWRRERLRLLYEAPWNHSIEDLTYGFRPLRLHGLLPPCLLLVTTFPTHHFTSTSSTRLQCD